MSTGTISTSGSSTRPRRAVLWGALVVMLLVAQGLLISLAGDFEVSRQQELSDAAVSGAAADLKQVLVRDLQSLQSLLWSNPPLPQWHIDATEMLRQRRTIWRIERRDLRMNVLDAVDTPFRAPLFSVLRRDQVDVEAQAACISTRGETAAVFSRSYFVPGVSGMGAEVMDVCIPIQQNGQLAGYMTASFGLPSLLEEAVAPLTLRSHELMFVESDGTRLARAGSRRGAGAFVSQRPVELPGLMLQLRADGIEGRPRLIPNVVTGLVLGLSIGLFVVVVLLVRDMRRRGRVETALADALAFRKAMEDSLVTGLRARDLKGRVTYANPAFCAMVGFTVEELMASPSPPYWPPEQLEAYNLRQADRLAGKAPPREGFETLFMRKNGERFPVMIYEAQLVDRTERHAGWMSAVVDLSAQRRVEDLSRQQQERLQASARLATVGEMASLLSHELNQPLAAIASYATGSLNLLAQPDAQTPGLLQQALQRIAEQAERAGRVIKSVHGFVRRRDGAREAIRADQLIEAVLPLVRLQARKSGTRIDVDCADPVPRVVCDRTMVEQVLLNLTRNAIQAMESDTPLADRVLTLRVRQLHPGWVTFGVIDRGNGIADEIAPRLFTPFFTTRSEGMGLGLSLCRTVIEQHGGVLDLATDASGPSEGAEFRFTLPAEKIAVRAKAATH